MKSLELWSTYFPTYCSCITVFTYNAVHNFQRMFGTQVRIGGTLV